MIKIGPKMAEISQLAENLELCIFMRTRTYCITLKFREHFIFALIRESARFAKCKCSWKLSAPRELSETFYGLKIGQLGAELRTFKVGCQIRNSGPSRANVDSGQMQWLDIKETATGGGNSGITPICCSILGRGSTVIYIGTGIFQFLKFPTWWNHCWHGLLKGTSKWKVRIIS